MTGFTQREGILLKRTPYGEGDLILYFLTSHGTDTYFAKSARQSKKRFGGQLDFFRRLKLRIFQKGELQWPRLDSCELLEAWEPLWQDVDRYLVACRWVELLRSLLLPGKGEDIYSFICDSFRYLSKSHGTGAELSEYDVRFQLKLSMRLGYGPNFESCLMCRTPPSYTAFFRSELGGIVCEACFSSRYNQDAHTVLISPETYGWLTAYQRGSRQLPILTAAGWQSMTDMLVLHWREHIRKIE